MVDKYIQGLIDREPADSSVKYQFLSRMKSDCEFFLGDSPQSHQTFRLWAQDVDDQIEDMKALWNSFPDDSKPEWLTMEQIDSYAKQMNEPVHEDRAIRIYLTNLTEYNKGNMVGAWVTLPVNAEEMDAKFKKLGIGRNQEYFITDYDTPFPELTRSLGEHENLDQLNYLAQEMKWLDEGEWDKFTEIIYSGLDGCTSVEDYLNLANTLNLRKFEMVEAQTDYEFGKKLCEGSSIHDIEVGGVGNLDLYIDYEKIGSDACANFDYTRGKNNYIRQTSSLEQIYEQVPPGNRVDPRKLNPQLYMHWDKTKVEPERGRL